MPPPKRRRTTIDKGNTKEHTSQRQTDTYQKNDTNIHAGIRTTLSGPSDYENDGYCGFEIVEAREIDTIGTEGIIKKIRDRVGTTNPVYLSLDIDTLDPACESERSSDEETTWELTADSRACYRHP